VEDAAQVEVRELILRPALAASGQRVELCWSLAGAARATIDPGVGDIDPRDFEQGCRPLTAGRSTTTYTLVATGRDGRQATRQITLNVQQAASPRILSVRFPNTASTIGPPALGQVEFEDTDGNLAMAEFTVVRGAGPSFTIDIGNRDRPRGTFTFSYPCQVPQEMTVRIVLHDVSGSRSEPRDFAFRCVGPAPTPTR
jgi:hypothetical protein